MTPWTIAHQSPLSIDFPGKNTVVGCHFLFQGIFLAQELNWNPCICCTGCRILLISKISTNSVVMSTLSCLMFTFCALLILLIFLKNELLGFIVSLLFCHFSISVLYILISVQLGSVAQSCLTLCDPWTAAPQASLSISNSQSLLKLMSIESVMPPNHLILCRPLLLLPLVFPNIKGLFK